jgi:hypothetical protein
MIMKGTVHSATAILTLLSATTLASSASGQATRVMTAPPPVTQAPITAPSNPQTSPINAAPAPVMANPNGPQADEQHPQPDEQFSAVEFDIHTGADDLRNNAWANATINFSDGSNQTCQLKAANADSWNNNSQHVVECHLDKTRTYDDLRKARILIVKDTYRAWPMWDYDNWNVDSIKVTAKDPDMHNDKCVWNSGGNPLIRLTGDAPQFAVEDYDTTC